MQATWKSKFVGAVATGAIVAGLVPMTAFGAGALTADTTITVSGLIEGDTATYYQVVTQDEATNAWKLTEAVDSDADGKIDGSELTIADLVITGNPDDAATDKEVITASMANAIAAALTTNKAEGTDMEAFNADGSSTAEVNPGLYMVVAVPSDTNKNTVYKPIFVSADYHNGDAEGAGNTNSIAIAKDETDYQDKSGVFKASDLTIDKVAAELDDDGEEDVDAKGVGVGDTVRFTVTTPVVGYTKNFTNPQFKVTDVMTEGVELVSGSIKVEVAGYELGEDDYTVTENGTSGYVVAFANDFLYRVVGAPVCTITYDATVTSAAAAQVNQMNNTVTLNFSNEPTDETGAGELTDKTRHYTFDIDGNVLGGSESTGGDPDKGRTEEVQKVYLDADETAVPAVPATEYNGTKALEGAEFQLLDKQSGKLVEWTDNVRSGVADGANDKTKIVSDSYGSLVMKGLDEGTYILKETKAPQGYTPDPIEHTIVISATYVKDADDNDILSSYTITVDGNESSYTVSLAGDPEIPQELIGDEPGTITVDPAAISTLIPNKELGILPSTGGAGLFLYLGVGGLVAVISTYLMKKNKKELDQLAE